MSRFLLAVPALCATCAYAAEEPAMAAELDSVVESIQSYQPAEPIERSAPSYPRKALDLGREAWINVAYCIDESGTPRNISILDSAGDDDFEKAAIRAVEKWRFEPSLVNGEPTWQSNNQTYILFAIDDESLGGTRQFARRFRKLVALLDDNQLADARVLFAELVASDRLNLYEQAKLWIQKARYEILAGDFLKADVALRRASISDGEWLDDESYIEVLKLRTQVQLQIGQYAAANSSFSLLEEKAGEESPAVASVRPVMERLWQVVESDAILETQAEIMGRGECFGCDDSFQFTPVRRHFSFAEIRGELNSIEMRCDHKRFESAVSDMVEWHVPDQWGRCTVQVSGEPGTTFKILALPEPAS